MKTLFINQIKNTLKTCLFVSFVASAVTVNADDTEVFSTANISNNLLFVMDVSGSMRRKVTTVTTTAGTTTTGGTPGVVGGAEGLPVARIQDDATQQLGSLDDAGAGAQTVNDVSLDFQPNNIVATRFGFDKYTIPRIGQRHPGYWKKARAKVSAVRIKSATLRFHASASNSENTEIDIFIENAAHNYARNTYRKYRNYYRNYYHGNYPTIEQRPKYGPVRWNPQNWSVDNEYMTVDVKSLVQQVVNLRDWDKRKFNSSLAFKFKTISGQRHAYSTDAPIGWGKVPHLDIEYDYDVKYRVRVKKKDRRRKKWEWHSDTYTTGNGYFPGEVHARTDHGWHSGIGIGYDDAEQAWVSASPQASYTESQWAFNSDQLIGVRFDLNPSNKIPKNSVVTRAYIQFTSAGDSSANARINVQIEDTGSAADYQSNPDILNRVYDASTQKTWTPPAWLNGEKNDNEKTPDLTHMVQRVVDRSDWDNALAFRFFGEMGDRIAYAMDSGNPPVLHIEYQNSGGASSGTTTGSGGVVTTTRVEKRIVLMQEALREVLESAPNVNVGLMKYSGMKERNRDHNENKRNHFVGGVLFPVSPIYGKASDFIGALSSRDNLQDPGNKTVREFIADVADGWEAVGGTPIVDALYEAALYYRGEKMHFGKNKNNGGDAFSSPGSNPSTYFGGAEIDGKVNVVGRSNIAEANYISPIKSECQSNYIVLMSDGGPTHYYSNSQYGWGNEQGQFASTLKGTNNSELAQAISSCQTGNGENTDNSVNRLRPGTCGREITQYLATHDQMPDAGRGGNEGVREKQTVKTFTIGFGQGLRDGAEEYLRSLATVDGQGYYTADNKEELKNAFRTIFETIANSSGSLASPGYSVNVKNGLEHEKDIYIPVFERRNTPTWSGNLKKFALVDDAATDKRLIKGKNDKAAVDTYGGFTNDALDYWSAKDANTTTPDGTDVLAGGVAEKINPDGRLVLTDAGCSDTSECVLTGAGNDYKLKDENTTITPILLGIDNQGLSDAEKATKRRLMINFIRGWDEGFYDNNATPKGYPRKHMGDMLHSEPVVITYAKGAADGTGKKQYILAGTNEGYIHAFDTVTGEEVFAFMPSELLKNIDIQFTDNGTAVDHKYGIDGSMTYWDFVDDNGDRKIYLYFGLRRGGKSYYALDITGLAEATPIVKRLWKKSSSDTGMSLLGQSWSPPYVARVGVETASGAVEKKEVVIVSGGYDEVHDRDKAGEPTVLNNAQSTVTTTMGHNVYILDANNGSLLWDLKASMGDTQLTQSIPGGLKLLDVNKNGLVDRLYFADVGGDLWRLDLSESLKTTGDDKSVLTKLADLAGAGTESRKFYTEPDVSTLTSNGKTIYMVSIGSGFRAHPNDKTINDQFFVIKDTSPYAPLPTTNYSATTLSDLATVTISDAGVVSQAHFDTRSKGWALDLPGSGEKVLSSSITFDGVVAFTTLVPAIVTANFDPCAPPIIEGRFYAVNILTGKPALDLVKDPNKNADDPDITDADISKIVIRGEIAGKPQVVFNEMTKSQEKDADGKVVSESCKHGIDVRVGKAVGQVSGYDACRLESIYWNNPKE